MFMGMCSPARDLTAGYHAVSMVNLVFFCFVQNDGWLC